MLPCAGLPSAIDLPKLIKDNSFRQQGLMKCTDNEALQFFHPSIYLSM
jgi:hypothetical protein